MTVRLTKHQAAVYRFLQAAGRPLPDAALVPMVQHMSDTPISSSGVRTRRAELVRKGLVRRARTEKIHGRNVGLFEAV